MVATHFFGKRYKNRGFRGFRKKTIFWPKKVELLPARFQGTPFFGCFFFFVFFFFFFFFSVSSASSKRVCKKNLFLLVFFDTLLKHLVTSCSNKEVKPKPPQRKGAHFFFGNPFFDQIFFSKTLMLHHPLKTVHQKISQNPYFYRLKKRMARLLTLPWPGY